MDEWETAWDAARSAVLVCLAPRVTFTNLHVGLPAGVRGELSPPPEKEPT